MGGGAQGIRGRASCSPNQGNRKTMPSPLPSASSLDSVYPREGIYPRGKKEVRVPLSRETGSLGPPRNPPPNSDFLTPPTAPLRSPLLAAATEKGERKPRGTPVSFGPGLELTISLSRHREPGPGTALPHPPAQFRLGWVSPER